MTDAWGMRTTSVAASAVLLGFGVLAAFSTSVTLQAIPTFEPPAVPMVRFEPPPPPPPPRPIATPPREIAPLDMTPLEPATTFDNTNEPVAFEPHVAPAGPALITDPTWLRRPSDLERYYPRRAITRNMSGMVTLDCIVSRAGALDCAVVSETPEGWGFGAAAQRIARDHRMAPAHA